MREVETFLTECQQRGSHVAGFLPPFSPTVYRVLEQDRHHYGYMFELAAVLAPLFDRLGGSFADFTNPARCEIQRDGFYDGQHASSPAYRRLWTCWTEADPRLRPFSSSAALAVNRLCRAGCRGGLAARRFQHGLSRGAPVHDGAGC